MISAERSAVRSSRIKPSSSFPTKGFVFRLPQTAQSLVPDLTARQTAIPAMQPFLNAFPLPNGADNTATNVAQFNTSYSNAASLDAYSLRIDEKLNDKLTHLRTV